MRQEEKASQKATERNKSDDEITPPEFVGWLREWLTNPQRKRFTYVEIGNLVLAAVIAAAALGSLWIFQGQLTVMERQTPRPWLGFDGNPVTRKVEVSDVYDSLPNKPDIKVPNGRKQVSWFVDVSINNFGGSPALHSVFSDDVSTSGDFNTLKIQALGSCPEADKLVRGSFSNQGSQIDERSYTLFPGRMKPQDMSMGFGSSDMEHLSGEYLNRIIYIMGCIAYLDQSGDTQHIHHTRLCYHTSHPLGKIGVGEEMIPCFWGQYAD